MLISLNLRQLECNTMDQEMSSYNSILRLIYNTVIQLNCGVRTNFECFTMVFSASFLVSDMIHALKLSEIALKLFMTPSSYLVVCRRKNMLNRNHYIYGEY